MSENIKIEHTVVVALIKELNNNSLLRTNLGGKWSNWFQAIKGLQYRCCVLPTVFKTYVQQALKSGKRIC